MRGRYELTDAPVLPDPRGIIRTGFFGYYGCAVAVWARRAITQSVAPGVCRLLAAVVDTSGEVQMQLNRAGPSTRGHVKKNTGERCMGRGRGGLTTKINARRGWPRARSGVCVVADARCTGRAGTARPLARGVRCWPTRLTSTPSERLQRREVPRANRRTRLPFDSVLYKQRNLIERSSIN